MGEAVFRGSQFTKRPDTGGVGDLTRVRANYFKVTKFQNMNISHYEVVISPTVPPRLNMKVFNRFVDQYRDRALGGARPVFDGKSNMFAHKSLPFEAHSFDVELEEDNAPMASRRPPRRFRIRIRKTRDIFLDDLFQFLEAKGDMTENCHMAIMAMDIIISHKVALRYPTVRRSFYTPRATKELPGGLEAWPGYYQSARPTRKGLMMININLTATAFYQSIPLVGLISKILAPYDIRRGLLGDNRHKVEDIIRKLKITDNHRAGNKRKFKIEGLTLTSASNTMFDRGDGSSIDVKTYFQNVYNKRLQYPYLPCVIVRRGVYLPIEICDVLPEQRYMRKLNKDQIEAMMDFARQNPNARANKIQEGLTILNYRGNEYLQQFGMSISNEMTEVNARILPTPTIKYHPSSREHDVQPKGGVWNLRDKRLATGMTLGSWSVLAFLDGNRWPDPVIYHFIREFVNTCEDTGMNIPNKRPPLLRANLQGNTEESLKQAWITAGNMAKSKPQLILCILPNMEINLYAEIKRVGDTIIGVATQCVQSVHMRQPKKQYCANVCLKVNVKLGGMNSCLDRGDIEFVDAEPTIVMGADVSHPPPGDREGRSSSFAALCASVDAKASRYAATIRAQEGRDEIIADLGNMVKELLKTFYQTCGSKPQRILFYRDGVSESQFVHVLRDEINAIRGACQALDVKYRPTITFVVVQKRHNTRFFPMERRYTDRSGNCLPGTVIDTDITHPFEFDFYLQSHAGLSSQSAGTSRPAHYHVLFDENGFHADSLQTLSYNLCYIYARCTRAVSLVPPVYYAHLVTARARLYSVADPTTYGVVKQELHRVMYFV